MPPSPGHRFIAEPWPMSEEERLQVGTNDAEANHSSTSFFTLSEHLVNLHCLFRFYTCCSQKCCLLLMDVRLEGWIFMRDLNESQYFESRGHYAGERQQPNWFMSPYQFSISITWQGVCCISARASVGCLFHLRALLAHVTDGLVINPASWWTDTCCWTLESNWCDLNLIWGNKSSPDVQRAACLTLCLQLSIKKLCFIGPSTCLNTGKGMAV